MTAMMEVPIDYGTRAPSYYHWSQEKPCTSNQTYGFLLRNHLSSDIKQSGAIDDYTRPFSNLGFFPEITSSGGLVAQHGRSRTAMSAKLPTRIVKPEVAPSPSSVNRFNINRGYTVGIDPIHKRLDKNSFQSGKPILRQQSAPAAYRTRVPDEKNIYLWHSLSGCLVHVKNKPAPAEDRTMFNDRRVKSA